MGAPKTSSSSVASEDAGSGWRLGDYDQLMAWVDEQFTELAKPRDYSAKADYAPDLRVLFIALMPYEFARFKKDVVSLLRDFTGFHTDSVQSFKTRLIFAKLKMAEMNPETFDHICECVGIEPEPDKAEQIDKFVNLVSHPETLGLSDEKTNLLLHLSRVENVKIPGSRRHLKLLKFPSRQRNIKPARSMASATPRPSENDEPNQSVNDNSECEEDMNPTPNDDQQLKSAENDIVDKKRKSAKDDKNFKEDKSKSVPSTGKQRKSAKNDIAEEERKSAKDDSDIKEDNSKSAPNKGKQRQPAKSDGDEASKKSANDDNDVEQDSLKPAPKKARRRAEADSSEVLSKCDHKDGEIIDQNSDTLRKKKRRRSTATKATEECKNEEAVSKAKQSPKGASNADAHPTDADATTSDYKTVSEEKDERTLKRQLKNTIRTFLAKADKDVTMRMVKEHLMQHFGKGVLDLYKSFIKSTVMDVIERL